MTTKLDWIKSQLLANEVASDAASRLNTPFTIENPNSQQDVPAPIDFYALRDVIPNDESGKVLNSLIWDRVTEALAIGDFRTVNNHIESLVGLEFLSLPTVAKLQEFMAATIPDPNYQPTIQTTLAKQAGYDLVYTHEVQEAIDNA
jgi:hypothetical protein